ncbi:zf-HC2 domain-containing protein [Chitinophaga sp. sic0106]|uniref:zf-HC2 domain-containing protein n=1 Tax=Chitinophaga sp. sic0106 TaxID=2854785 RepID=UPI001C451F6B|nr:zf-HC2 domain-containing protein [Chitinophaga sp. sic0106]MBV7531494.1 zf-HC2 domain-containing protein [Chitinophaga sp. sic0106]
MLSNSDNNDKVIKIFSGIRCVSKDQLPRYLDGRLTDVEKHLVEQHLTDCDLCFEALQALEKEGSTEKYADLTSKLQRYIQQSIRPVSQEQKVAQYTRKERNKENLLVYFWVLAFGILGVSGVYVLKGHMRNNPTIPRLMVSAIPPAEAEKIPATATAVTSQPIVTPDHPSNIPSTPPAAASTPANNTAAPVAVDSARIKLLAAERAAKKKIQADSILKANQDAAEVRRQDSLKKLAEEKDKEQKEKEAAEAAANAAKEKEKEPEPAPKKEEVKKEEAPPVTNSIESLYKVALQYQQQGNLSEAMDRYKRIEANGSGKYVEMARYQLGICYRSKGQSARAKRMFKEVVKMDGSLKAAAQQALDTM